MSNALSNALSIVASDPIPELTIIITVDHETSDPRITPDVCRVPDGFRGIIRWQIDHPDAAFADPPILFLSGPSTVPPPTDTKNCQVWWNNDNAGTTAQIFRYDVNLLHALKVLNPDPTVENDPPRPLA